MISYIVITIIGVAAVFSSFYLAAKILSLILKFNSKLSQRLTYVLFSIGFIVMIGSVAIVLSKKIKQDAYLTETYFLVAYIVAIFFCAYRYEKIMKIDMQKIWS